MVPSLVFESMTCGRHWQDPAASGTGKVQHRDPLLQRGIADFMSPTQNYCNPHQSHHFQIGL